VGWLIWGGGVGKAKRRRLRPIRKRRLAFEGLEEKRLLAADVWTSGGRTFSEVAGTLTLDLSASEVSNSVDVDVSVDINAATEGDDFTIANQGTITFTVIFSRCRPQTIRRLPGPHTVRAASAKRRCHLWRRLVVER